MIFAFHRSESFADENLSFIDQVGGSGSRGVVITVGEYVMSLSVFSAMVECSESDPAKSEFLMKCPLRVSECILDPSCVESL